MGAGGAGWQGGQGGGRGAGGGQGGREARFGVCSRACGCVGRGGWGETTPCNHGQHTRAHTHPLVTLPVMVHPGAVLVTPPTLAVEMAV